ncbi:P2Y purinoceptor 3-like [Mesocricetus auratus]|uniref:P2Y purinoceptor 3-like n=1 Tax=Mesocricetus auratus TaxID=10036 RepID=A0ABM2XXM7_MESAU|nr:P2Y purinoceptor 3-like [Mesocricetus auratus]
MGGTLPDKGPYLASPTTIKVDGIPARIHTSHIKAAPPATQDDCWNLEKTGDPLKLRLCPLLTTEHKSLCSSSVNLAGEAEVEAILEGAFLEMEKLDLNASKEQGACHFSERYKQVYLSITYSIIFILGLVLNGAVLWLSFCQTKPWSCATIYLMNLMVADLLYVMSLPFLVITYSVGDTWVFGEMLCRLVRFLFYTNLYSSTLLLTCISVHRFLGVCRPLSSLSYRTHRHTWQAAAATWTLVVLQLLPTLVFSHTGYVNGQVICYDTASPENFGYFFAYSMVLMVSGFVFPSLIILVCYALMVRSLAYPVEALSKTGHTARAKSVRTILLVCSLFTLCFVPFHIARSFYLVIRFWNSQDCQLLSAASMAYKICRPLVSMSSCLNPILYFLSQSNNRVQLLQKLRQNKVPTGEGPRLTADPQHQSLQ